MRSICAAAFSTLVAITPATAQDPQTGQVAESAVGQAGRRQTREQPMAGIEPMARVNSRIQSRVQSRIHNRLDRFYDPQVNTASPFEVASDQARIASRPSRR